MSNSTEQLTGLRPSPEAQARDAEKQALPFYQKEIIDRSNDVQFTGTSRGLTELTGLEITSYAGASLEAFTIGLEEQRLLGENGLERNIDLHKDAIQLVESIASQPDSSRPEVAVQQYISNLQQSLQDNQADKIVSKIISRKLEVALIASSELSAAGLEVAKHAEEEAQSYAAYDLGNGIYQDDLKRQVLNDIINDHNKRIEQNTARRAAMIDTTGDSDATHETASTPHIDRHDNIAETPVEARQMLQSSPELMRSLSQEVKAYITYESALLDEITDETAKQKFEAMIQNSIENMPALEAAIDNWERVGQGKSLEDYMEETLYDAGENKDLEAFSKIAHAQYVVRSMFFQNRQAAMIKRMYKKHSGNDSTEHNQQFSDLYFHTKD